MYKYILKYNVGSQLVTKNITPRVAGSVVRTSEGYRIRYKFNGKFSLNNEPQNSIYDYDLFKSIENSNYATRCFVEFQKYVDNVWVKEFEGYFYPFECKVNEDLCTVEITELKPYDQYSLIDEYWDKEFNVLKWVAPGPTFNLQDPLRLEFFESSCDYSVHFFTNFNPTCDVPIASPTNYVIPQYDTAGIFYKGFPHDPYSLSGTNYFQWHPFAQPYAILSSWFLYNDPTVFNYGYPVLADRDLFISLLRPVKNEITVNSFIANNQVPDGLGNIITLPLYYITVKTTWAFEVAVTADDPETLTHVAPSGTGWNLMQYLIINNIPHAKYARRIFDANPVYAYAVTESVCSQYYKYELLDPNTGTIFNTRKIYRARDLYQTLITLIAQTGYNGLVIESKFFNDAINPYTGEQNTKYVIDTALDIKQPLTEYPSKELLLSIQDIFEGIQTKLPIEWVIEKRNGLWTLMIEHVYFFENGYSYGNNANTEIDVRGLVHNSLGTKQIVKTNKYEYEVEEIYNREKLTDNEYFNDEFAPLSINYDLALFKKEKLYASQWITDIGGILAVPTEFSSSSICLLGIKLMPVDQNTSEWFCLTEEDFLTGISVANGHLAPANLINKYWRKYRILINALLDTVPIVFESMSRKKIQQITVTDCDLSLIHTNSLIRTNLGSGRIQEGNYDMLKQTTDLTLKL